MQNNVVRIITFLQILQKHTDEKNSLSRNQLIEMMEELGFSMNRKTLYEYIKQLKEVGYPIGVNQSKDYGYYLSSEPFSFAQAKLLVDAVQTSKVLEKEMSTQLISNITSSMSKYEASALKRKLYMSEKVKTFNKNIYSMIDKIHEATQQKNKLSFRYFDIVLNHKNEIEKRYRHDGLEYVVSPYSLVWADDNYYMVAHYPKHEGLTNFRVDRMDLVMVKKEKRTSLSEATSQADFSIAKYSQRLFSMFKGEEIEIVLHAKEHLLNVIYDRFGNHATYKRNNDIIEIKVHVSVSAPFFGWVFQYGDGIQLISPSKVVKEYKNHLHQVLSQYRKEE